MTLTVFERDRYVRDLVACFRVTAVNNFRESLPYLGMLSVREELPL